MRFWNGPRSMPFIALTIDEFDCYFGLDKIIQNGRPDLSKSRGTSSVELTKR